MLFNRRLCVWSCWHQSLFQHGHSHGRSCRSLFSRVAAVHLAALPSFVTIAARLWKVKTGWDLATRLEATPSLVWLMWIGLAFDVGVVGTFGIGVVGTFGTVGVEWNPRGSALFAQSWLAGFAGPAANQATVTAIPWLITWTFGTAIACLAIPHSKQQNSTPRKLKPQPCCLYWDRTETKNLYNTLSVTKSE